MLETSLCGLLGISYPIVQAAIWPATGPQLAAAVSNAGGLGSLGAVFTSADDLERQIDGTRALTDRPFAINHVVPLLDEEAFARTLTLRPAVISLALGDPGELVARAQASGAKVIHQVHTVAQAHQAAERGVDAIVAQGVEAGGQGLAQGPSTMVLVPQVVDAVHPIPVLAAGGIADGRGLAAALVLGAQGANIGTRFLASVEAAAPPAWKQAIVEAASEQVVRFEPWQDIMPSPDARAYATVPSVLRTPFVDTWRVQPDAARREAARLREEISTALAAGRAHELVPFTGQSAGMVHHIQPAAEIVEALVATARQALRGVGTLQST